jgi:hypothetical protein
LLVIQDWLTDVLSKSFSERFANWIRYAEGWPDPGSDLGFLWHPGSVSKRHVRSRVTRFGEFLPIVRKFHFGCIKSRSVWISAKTRVGPYLGRFFWKLIWSPWYIPTCQKYTLFRFCVTSFWYFCTTLLLYTLIHILGFSFHFCVTVFRNFVFLQAWFLCHPVPTFWL